MRQDVNITVEGCTPAENEAYADKIAAFFVRSGVAECDHRIRVMCGTILTKSLLNYYLKAYRQRERKK